MQLFDSLHAARRRVSPFGNLRIEAHLQLPEAYRSLSRPSSAPDAKAFPLRSFSLNLTSMQAPYRALRRKRQSLLTPLRLLFLANFRSLGGDEGFRAC